jgi:hypothetical protein
MKLDVLAGKACTILGSAPNPVLPKRTECVCAANGGVVLAPVISDRVVDVLATTSYLFRPNPSEVDRHTLAQMSGREVDTLLVGTKDGPMQRVIDGCKQMYLKYNRVIEITPEIRARVVLGASGMPLGDGVTPWRVSTGVFLACLAVVSGAARVVLSGVSLMPGYVYLPGAAVHRDHVPADEQCLRAMTSKLMTTQTELMELGLRGV